jgi:predicted nucleic acid-binding protein
LLLIDERAGILEARRLGFNATGTLGVLARAAERKMIDVRLVLDRLRATNFRATPELFHRLMQTNDEAGAGR